MVLINKNTHKQEKITNTLALSQVAYHLEMLLPSSFVRALQAQESLSDPLMCVCVCVHINGVKYIFTFCKFFVYFSHTLYTFYILSILFVYFLLYKLFHKFRTIHTIS